MPVTTGSFRMVATCDVFMAIHPGLVNFKSRINRVCTCPVLLFSRLHTPSVGLLTGRMFFPSLFVLLAIHCMVPYPVHRLKRCLAPVHYS